MLALMSLRGSGGQGRGAEGLSQGWERQTLLVIFQCSRVCVCSVIQSSLTLCNCMDCSPPGFSVHGISKQEYWSGLLFPSPGDLPDPGIKPASLCLLHWQADSSPLAPPGKRLVYIYFLKEQGSIMFHVAVSRHSK